MLIIFIFLRVHIVLICVAWIYAHNIPGLKHSFVEFQDEIYKTDIAMLPQSNENRVISFALYGNDKKYTYGAIRNAEIAPVSYKYYYLIGFK